MTHSEPKTELLHSLSQTGARLRCFRHTVEEIDDSLSACERLLRRKPVKVEGAVAETYYYFVDNGCGPSDVALAIANLEKDLQVLRVFVEDIPEFTPKYVVDEEGFADHLDTSMGYKNPRARDRDVASVSAIARLRKGHKYARIEDCVAVFMTTNRRLAGQTQRFFQHQNGADTVAYCIAEYALTNLLWLRQPTEAPELPRKMIIADCYAATQPDEYLWGLYLSKMEQLQSRQEITVEDYYTFRHIHEAKAALMEVTLGNEDALTEGTIAEIIKRTRERISAETHAQLLEAQNEIRKRNQSDRERDARIRKRAEKQAYRIATGMKYLTYIIVVIFLLLSLPLDFFSLQETVSKTVPWYLLTGIFAIGLLWSWWSFKDGRTLDEVFGKLEGNLANWREKEIRKSIE